MKHLLLFLCSMIFIVGSAQTKIIGKVVWVEDGDTFKIKTKSGKNYWIRLAGIDCPETGQNFARKAKDFTFDRCYKSRVTLKIIDRDRYGRLIAWVILEKGKKLNLLLVKKGLAWHYKKYNHSPILASLQKKAQSLDIGLWKEMDPTPPWKYRHR